MCCPRYKYSQLGGREATEGSVGMCPPGVPHSTAQTTSCVFTRRRGQLWCRELGPRHFLRQLEAGDGTQLVPAMCQARDRAQTPIQTFHAKAKLALSHCQQLLQRCLGRLGAQQRSPPGRSQHPCCPGPGEVGTPLGVVPGCEARELPVSGQGSCVLLYPGALSF